MVQDKVELISLSTLPLQSSSNHHIIGRGREYATARLASREESRVQAQIAHQKALMKEIDVPTSSKSTSFGERYTWSKSVSPRNLSTLPLAFEEARNREWIAQVEAAYAEQKARIESKYKSNSSKWPRLIETRQKDAGCLSLASVRHVPTRFGFTSGRCTGPLPSQTFQLTLSEQQYEIEMLINSRKYWRFGDFLQNKDSAQTEIV